MKLLDFKLIDVSEDEELGIIWAHTSETTRVFLWRSGFQRLGIFHTWLRRQHFIREVHVSADLRTAVMTRRDEVEFVSLFQDGSILVTVHQPAETGWLYLDPTTLMFPRDRYCVEVISGSLEAVMARHEERLANHDKASSALVPVASMHVYLATRIRLLELWNARALGHLALSSSAAIAAALLTATVLKAAMGAGPPTGLQLAAYAVGVLTASVVPAMVVFFRAPAAILVHLRRTPPLRSADELLRLAEAVPRQPLPRLEVLTGDEPM